MTAPNTFAAFEACYQPEPNSGCWLWTGYSANGRYGRLRWQGRKILAHVFSYQHHISAVPEGKVLDHLCRNTFCVNPLHLEPVTQLENMRRSKNAIKDRCVHGHLYTDGMEVYENKKRRYRRCLICYRLRYPGTLKNGK